MKKERAIVHMDLDTFFVSCERLLDSRLNGKPILIGGTSDRGVVASCSYEARKFGIHSAMPMKMAKERCPEAIVIKGNSSIYTKYSRIVTEIIKESAPVYEKSSIDEFYIDLSGMDRFFGCKKYAHELRQRIIKESGLPISFGLSENKTVSKIATGEAKPNNAMNIDYGTERDFLAPLSIRKIPSVGLKTYHTFCGLGVKKIKTLQEMPLDLLEHVFGKHGRAIWKKAHGIDPSPVIQYNERKSISTERTFDRDTIDMIRIRAILTAMAENLAFQLRRAQKVCACVAVKVRYSDFQTTSLQKHIPYTAADHEIIPLVLSLFEKAYNRRVRIRLIGVKLSQLVNGSHQIDLFQDDLKQVNLYAAMDKIRNRFGDRSIMRAAGMEAKSIGRTNPFNGEPPVLLANRRR
ncbi:MAG: DNA polymerase IV [Brumimicrobium sp.]|nr:DNA polymerase IV [Brumimicrobium sp.]